METEHSWWLKGIIRKEREKVNSGATTESANLQTEGRTCEGQTFLLCEVSRINFVCSCGDDK